MRIIIVGSGRVGAQLANTLSAEGHDVTVVDKDPRAFRRLSRAFRGTTLQGVGFDRDVLLSAGVETADALAALTRGDNSNVLAALIARRVFQVPKVVARINDPERAAIYRRFGIPTISPTTWGANAVRDLLLVTELTPRYTFASGEVVLVEVAVPPRLDGHPIGELTGVAQMVVAAIVRDGRAFVPTSGALLRAGDLIFVSVESVSMSKLAEMVRGF